MKAVNLLAEWVEDQKLKYATSTSRMSAQAAEALQHLEEALIGPGRDIQVTEAAMQNAVEQMQLAEWFTAVAVRDEIDPKLYARLDTALTTDHTPMLSTIQKVDTKLKRRAMPESQFSSGLRKVADLKPGTKAYSGQVQRVTADLKLMAGQIMDLLAKFHDAVPVPSVIRPALPDTDDLLEVSRVLGDAVDALPTDLNDAYTSMLGVAGKLPFASAPFEQLTASKIRIENLERVWHTQLARFVEASTRDSSDWTKRLNRIRVNQAEATEPTSGLRAAWERIAASGNPSDARYTNDIDKNIRAARVVSTAQQRLRELRDRGGLDDRDCLLYTSPSPRDS